MSVERDGKRVTMDEARSMNNSWSVSILYSTEEVPKPLIKTNPAPARISCLESCAQNQKSCALTAPCHLSRIVHRAFILAYTAFLISILVSSSNQCGCVLYSVGMRLALGASWGSAAILGSG